MHVEYRVKLPDHDWVVTDKHNLIPSVYALINIDPDKIGNPKAVGYIGPTYISIRSGNCCSSTAVSPAKDFNELLKIKELESYCKNDDGSCKPVVIIISDGGPDENPR